MPNVEQFAKGVTAAAPVGGAIAGSLGSIASTMIANKARAEEAEKAYKREQESINKMNFYNSPSQQILRLRAAGLNPNLMYGNGGESAAGLQSSAAQGYQSNPAVPNLEAIGSNVAEGIQASLEAQRTINDTERTAAQVALQSIQGYEAFNNAEHTALENKTFMERFGVEMDQMRLDCRKAIEEINNLKKDASLKDIMYKVQEMNIKVDEAQIQKLASDTGLNFAQIHRVMELLPHEVRNMDANTAFLYFQQRPEFIQKLSAEIYALKVNADSNAQNAYTNFSDFEKRVPLYEAQASYAGEQAKYFGATSVANIVYGGINAACQISNAINRWANPLSSIGAGKAGASAAQFDFINRTYEATISGTPHTYAPNKYFYP